jgi:hypothetical protein
VLKCAWTYNRAAGGSNSLAISNPAGSRNANLFLYNRTVLYVLVMKPGTAWSKVNPPLGTNAVHWYGSDGG